MYIFNIIVISETTLFQLWISSEPLQNNASVVMFISKFDDTSDYSRPSTYNLIL